MSPRKDRTQAAPVVDDWGDAEYEHAGFWRTRWHKRSVRRRKTKARVAAMTRGRRYARRGMILSTWALGFVAVLMLGAIVAYYAFTDVPRPEDLPVDQVATIQYADGTTLARVGTTNRTLVDLSDVPEHVRWAVLAAEDRNFYGDGAISIRGTVRAALSNVTGGDTQGGSGITQQYVKNAYPSVGTERTITRKLKELMIAVKLSRDYSKDQILEYYLNTVYFGRGAYGIQAAARTFFGVDVSKLTVAQGAVLAGLLRSPAYYDPVENPTASRGRWNYVLDGMVATKHLTETQRRALVFPKARPVSGSTLGVSGWKYLLKNAVMAELQTHGISANDVARRGLVIRTTIDPKAQAAALDAVRTNFDSLTKKQKNLKNAIVAVRPSDGGVLAYYGGTGPDVKGNDGQIDYNDYASRGARPPGSSFKPFVLATALTDTVNKVKDVPHLTINSTYEGRQCVDVEGTKICNDPGDESLSAPKVTLRNAMKWSLNTTFDTLASELGPDKVAATAHALGIATTNPDGAKTLQDAKGRTTFGIGIGDYPVTVTDMADAYATLANGGLRNDEYLVSKATASDGEVVYQHQQKQTRAVDARVANDVTVTLKPVAAWSQDPLSGGRPSAAKTGTAGVSGRSSNNSDAWMVGYTPQVSAAVWVGTGYSKPIYDANGNPLYGAGLPGRTWKTFMDTYLQGATKLPLPSNAEIASDGSRPDPATSSAPAPTETVAPSSSSVPPSTSRAPAPRTSSSRVPAPPTTSSAPPSTPPPSTPTSTCGGVIQQSCSSSSPPGNGGGGAGNGGVDQGGGGP